MPGSCDAEQNSPRLISSLRQFRFQNKAKQSQPLATSTQSSSKSNSGPVLNKNPNNSELQKSSSSSYNPLGYRKYENTNTAESLRNIWGKIRASFKNNATISIIDLILSVEETKLLKDTVLQQPAISVKWSTSITEHAAKDSNDKLLKIKRMYIHELLKCVSDELKTKYSINISGQLTSEKLPVRTYSRKKQSEKTLDQNILNNTSFGDQSQGAMDDYEEFCEKEQCLRKMLQTFPGADIMEAQDILVKCQWDLNKAIIEARNQPLRTARKRGFPGNSVSPSSTPNIVNQTNMETSQPIETDRPEEIVLDSSDEDEVNGRTLLQSKPATNVCKPATSVSIPATNVSIPVTNVSVPSTNVSVPATSVSVPVTSVSVPATSVLKPATSVSKPATSVSKPTTGVSKPTTGVSKPTTGVSKPTAGVSKPTASVSKPTASVSKPTASASKPTASASKPTASASKPTASASKPTASASKPTASVSKPTTSSSKPTANVSKPTTDVSSPVLPPAKRARRQISTDSEDEMTSPERSPSPKNVSSSKSHLTVLPVQQKSNPSVQKPSIVQNNTASDKTINVPHSLSIKPVPVSTSSPAPLASTEKTSVSSMPSLPKGLVMIQVDDLDCIPKKSDEISVNGNASNIPSNTTKSVQMVKIKTSNKASFSSNPSSPAGVASSSVVTTSTSSSKTVNIPLGKGVSLTPINQTPSFIKSKSKTLSITPVNNVSSKESSLKVASESSSEEESSSNEQKIQQTKVMKLVNESNGKERLPETSKTCKLNEPKEISEQTYASNSGKRKRFSSDEEDDEEYGNEDIYDSEDSDCEENLTSAHSAVLKFFQDASPEELGSIPGCSKKKIEAINNLKPFTKWIDLVEKLKNDKALSTDLLNGAKKVLDMRNAVTKLMTKCQRISLDMEDLVENLKENKESSSDYVSKQPEMLNERMHLTPYQMLGLNWLLLMHNQEVNAILADEMGLGKTVQAISFLAYLKQIEEEGPHLIVVPSSTLDNWRKELETWWPSVSVICYHGSQESRRELRMQILNDEIEEFDIMITTYNMVTSSAEDRNFFKRLDFNYVVFDEAHMLKNMASQRYSNLMRIKAPRRLLLTGTPLQNNLVELMSLLIFAMPNMFSGKIDQIKQMFSCVSKTASGNKNTYEKDRIEHAKRIMRPFVLRRLKKDVLKELPQKKDETRFCPMVEDQAKKYEDLIAKFSEQVQVESNEDREKDPSTSGAGMMMQLRRAANHPLLLRRFFDDSKLLSMSKLMLNEPTHNQSDPNIIFEDMAVMSDFELHKLCCQYKSLKSFVLSDNAILNSGKFKVLDELLPDMIKEDHRILLFSQFTMVLDIIQEYMNIKKYKFLRLDGQVPVSERQQLIDEFNNDPEILFFLLSTKAGGLGINLTAADTVILHDIDFNPYNDKQAEDRCHRVGQVRDVRVIRMISEKTIEEGILQRAKEKLKLEKDIHDEGDCEENDNASVAMLLRDALGLKPKS